MDADNLAAAFTAAVRYSRSERHDEAIATWRKVLHEAAGREDDLPFKAFSDWLDERDLAAPETLHRLRSDGAHATPMHFAQHPETGEVMEWPRRSNRPLVTSPAEFHELRKASSPYDLLHLGYATLAHIEHGPGGLVGVESRTGRVTDGNGAGTFVVQYSPDTGIQRSQRRVASSEEAVAAARSAAWPSRSE